jgi:hypothetical protein
MVALRITLASALTLSGGVSRAITGGALFTTVMMVSAVDFENRPLGLLRAGQEKYGKRRRYI